MRKFILALILILLYLSSFSQIKTGEEYFLSAKQKAYSNQVEAALTDVNRAIELDTTISEAYFLRAKLLGKTAQSKKDLLKAIELGHAEAKEVYEQYFETIGKDKSLTLKEKFDQYIKTYPDKMEGYYDRGNLYFDLAEYDKAIEDYDKVIELEEYPVAYYNRGLCYINLNNNEKGCLDIKKASELGYEKAKQSLPLCLGFLISDNESKNRPNLLRNKNWKSVSVFIGEQNIPNELLNMSFNFEKNGKYTGSFGVNKNIPNDIFGEWEFIEKNTKIILDKGQKGEKTLIVLGLKKNSLNFLMPNRVNSQDVLLNVTLTNE